MCIADTAQFGENTGLAFPYAVVDLYELIHVQVANLSDEPVIVKNGTRISRLDECEQFPYFISMSIPTNSIKPSDKRYLHLSDLESDVPALSKSERAQLQELIDNFQHLFANDTDTPGRTTLVQHHIDLEEGTRPFKLPARRIPMHLQAKQTRKFANCLMLASSNRQSATSPPRRCWYVRRMGLYGFA